MSIKKVLSFGCGCLLFVMLGAALYRLHHIDQVLSILVRPARLFNPALITSKMEHRPELDVATSPHHDRFFYVICQQQFNWLGRGAQVVVFESQDQKYVVKFFQIARLGKCAENGFWKNLRSKESAEKRMERVLHKEEFFSSAKISFEDLSDETGIIYAHLNRTDGKINGMKLVDRFGQSHRIRGDDACFVVQKKAAYLIPTITQLMECGDEAAAQQRLDQVFALLQHVAQKGFIDGDDALIRNNNLGFTDTAAIYIDTGHLVRSSSPVNMKERMEYEFSVRLKPLENWINVAYPQLAGYYADRQSEIMAGL